MSSRMNTVIDDHGMKTTNRPAAPTNPFIDKPM
jgi:hypothetical protein